MEIFYYTPENIAKVVKLQCQKIESLTGKSATTIILGIDIVAILDKAGELEKPGGVGTRYKDLRVVLEPNDTACIAVAYNPFVDYWTTIDGEKVEENVLIKEEEK